LIIPLGKASKNGQHGHLKQPLKFFLGGLVGISTIFPFLANTLGITLLLLVPFSSLFALVFLIAISLDRTPLGLALLGFQDLPSEFNLLRQAVLLGRFFGLPTSAWD
jgi:hypothetical protein